jgi:hypothetical protein
MGDPVAIVEGFLEYLPVFDARKNQLRPREFADI